MRATALGAILAKAGGVATNVRESLDIETLTDSGETTAENNSSTIVQLVLNGMRIVLTADAGIPALDHAADYLNLTGRTPESLRLVQVPHHGSKRNVGPSILDRLLGPKLGRDDALLSRAVAPPHQPPLATCRSKEDGHVSSDRTQRSPPAPSSSCVLTAWTRSGRTARSASDDEIHASEGACGQLVDPLTLASASRGVRGQ